MQSTQDPTVAVIGLGYVGLPLAVSFGKRYRTIGYDLNKEKIGHFERGEDPTGEVGKEDFEKASGISFTSDPGDIREADFIIVAVPTPIDAAHQPDLRPLEGATRTVGRHMKKGAVVVFESTVYPGVTEEVCVPILEKESGMKWKEDFHVGYSPERINPGDREHTLERIVKVVSGDDGPTLEKVADLYGSIVEAGVYRTATIKEAEAAKVIENTQRDLNIALMNELAIIFDRLGIDTVNVLSAAGTKWNFLPFRPGLVGGHCIGVDPYYLTHKAEVTGYHPQVILGGRRINDGMGKFVAEKTVKMLIRSGQNAKGARVGVLGLTFKEDCPDLRNSKVVDIVTELESFFIEVLVHDPRADAGEAMDIYGIELKTWDELKDLNGLVVAVPHREYREKPAREFLEKLTNSGCLVDVKAMFDPRDFQDKDIYFWRL